MCKGPLEESPGGRRDPRMPGSRGEQHAGPAGWRPGKNHLVSREPWGVDALMF